MGLFGGSKSKSKIIADCYTRSDVPGRTIEKSLRLVQHICKEESFQFNISKDIDRVFESLLEKAKENGANVIVNVRMITGSNRIAGGVANSKALTSQAWHMFSPKRTKLVATTKRGVYVIASPA